MEPDDTSGSPGPGDDCLRRGKLPTTPDPVRFRHRIRWVLATLVGLFGLVSQLGCTVAITLEIIQWSRGESFNGLIFLFAIVGLALGVLLLHLAYRSVVRPTATGIGWISAMGAFTFWGPVGWLTDRVLITLTLWLGLSSIHKNLLHALSFLISSWLAGLVFRRLRALLLAEPAHDQNDPSE